MSDAMEPDVAVRWAVSLRDLDWGWSRAELSGLIERLGYTDYHERSSAALAVTDLGYGPVDVTIELNDDDVHLFGVPAVRQGQPRTPETIARGQDQFAALVAAFVEEFGPPTSRRLGDRPEARWRGERCTVLLHRIRSLVLLQVATNEGVAYSDELERLQERPA